MEDMRKELGMVLSAAVLAVALPQAARAAEAQAPPTLTPAVAQQVAAACPEAARYADALVRGITARDAVAATPLLEACATRVRSREARWKNDVAQLALAAAELSRGLLSHDPALLRAAADATRELRERSAASNEAVRTWTVIPDYYDAQHQEPVVLDSSSPCTASGADNAAYINVAARSGTAWITAQRPVRATAARGLACSAPSYSFDWQNQHGMSGRNTRTSAPTVVSSPSGSEPALQPSETRPGGR